jgi:hypothetical protein
MQEFTRQTDQHHRTIFTADSLNLWVSFYCDFYGAVMLAAVCMFAVGAQDRGASVVGLAFSNTIQVLYRSCSCGFLLGFFYLCSAFAVDDGTALSA